MTISESIVGVEFLKVSMFTVYYKSGGTGAKCYAFDCTSFEMCAKPMTLSLNLILLNGYYFLLSQSHRNSITIT